MSVLIKGQDMPLDCFECIAITYIEFGDSIEYYCLAKYRDMLRIDDYLQSGKRPPECPLVEVPTPHGRLIDAASVIKWTRPDEWGTPDERWRPESEFGALIDAAPTVIESEGGEND